MREHGEAKAAAIFEEFTQQMRAVAEASKRRARLTASGTASRGRVTVTVNADGVVIATRFSSDIEELTYDEIAKAVTAAAQQATAEVARLAAEVMRPVNDQRSRMPKLSELIEGLPDVEAHAPPIPAAPLSAPNSRERLEQQNEPEVVFTDSQDYEEWRSTGSTGATDRSW
ncbi:YbaB/EbfC family nucleoid-associated protein [Nocardia sp. NPDC050406]|uniref:YbaB/EbfC family nucleoid-associated protein n=1 Tax=Nocardia sp. NPDC050406 TaxID=3364318 RepID=UPI00378A7C59